MIRSVPIPHEMWVKSGFKKLVGRVSLIDDEGARRRVPRAGRLYVGDRSTFSLAWNLGARIRAAAHFTACIDLVDGGGYVSLGVLGQRLSVSVEGIDALEVWVKRHRAHEASGKPGEGPDIYAYKREFQLAAHDGLFVLRVWRNLHSSRSQDKLDVCWNVRDAMLKLAFGELEKRNIDRGTRVVSIYLPEGKYSLKVRRYDVEERWPRFRAMHVRKFAEVTPIGEPPPVPGKGTMSYNCGVDAIYSSHIQARTHGLAAASYLESVMATRERYGGSTEWQPPVSKFH